MAKRSTNWTSDSAKPNLLDHGHYLRTVLGAGPLSVPFPVPIVSPVVPLFSTPLLTPDPGLGRLMPFAVTLPWLGLAGETAGSPVVVVEPVLAFCAKTSGPDKISAVTAINIEFICFSNSDRMVNEAAWDLQQSQLLKYPSVPGFGTNLSTSA